MLVNQEPAVPAERNAQSAQSAQSALQHEWITLQNNHEQYEKNSLLIKLFAVALFAAALAVGMNDALSVLLIAVLWLQEGIFKTFQSRLGARILHLETLLKAEPSPPGAAFQLHSDWATQRTSGARMIAEYLRNALRPTVAYPYVVLLLITLAMVLAAPAAI